MLHIYAKKKQKFLNDFHFYFDRVMFLFRAITRIEFILTKRKTKSKKINQIS